jgi:hypothetical protein
MACDDLGRVNAENRQFVQGLMHIKEIAGDRAENLAN